MSGPRDDLAVAVEALIRARVRPAVETENELQIDAALSAAADDVAAACRERERVSYHAGRDDERVGAPISPVERAPRATAAERLSRDREVRRRRARGESVRCIAAAFGCGVATVARALDARRGPVR